MSTTNLSEPAAESPALESPARHAIEAGRAALVLIDIQEKLLPPIHNRDELLRNTKLLLKVAGALNLPVLATTQYAKGLGQLVSEVTDILPGATKVHDKLPFSCFGDGAFCSEISQIQGRDQFLVCGMETHICVMQTTLEALRRGFLVHVVADAVGSRSEFNWRVGLDRMRAAGAVISSTETAIYELLKASGTAAFRQVLPWLKK